MELTIRTATKNDASGIGAVHYKAWMETYTGLLPESFLASRSVEKSVAFFEKTECRDVVVAEADGTIIGFCGWGEFRDPAGERMGEIQGIYVLDAYKRKHIGRKMMEHALSELKSSGYRKVGLWVLDTNTNAIAFYEKLGFADGEDRKQADLGEVITELLYVKDI